MSLTVEHADKMPGNPGAPTNFTGTTSSQLVATGENGSVNVYRVTFERGGRTFWHAHEGEQVLYFLEGRGRVQLRGEPPVDAVAGDVVHIPPKAEHWHGAHPDEPQRLRHMAITFGAVTWLGPVAEGEYRSATALRERSGQDPSR